MDEEGLQSFSAAVVRSGGSFFYEFCVCVLLLQMIQEIGSCVYSSGELFLAWAQLILDSCILDILNLERGRKQFTVWVGEFFILNQQRGNNNPKYVFDRNM